MSAAHVITIAKRRH